MNNLTNKKILLGLCGGIAAYKSAFLVRELVQQGAEVRIVMTQHAKQFITPLTLQALSGHAVRCELFDAEAERGMSHIELARWADCLLIAPASANCISKLAQGLADDLLSTLYLVTKAPVFICPAMNHCMWTHPAIQHQCEQLRQRGTHFIGPDEGAQACGEEGFGRLSDISTIIAQLQLAHSKPVLADQEVIITAGPTREAIDPVRYITNYSSGKMGYALAMAAAQAGAHVRLISGPTALPPPPGVEYYPVTTAQEMLQTVEHHLTPTCIFIGAAAVADFRVMQPASHKIKKDLDASPLTLTLQPNPDILAQVATRVRYAVGFAAETERVVENALLKLNRKNAHLIIANQVGHGIGFDQNENQVTLLTKTQQIALPLQSKIQLAGEIVNFIAKEQHHLG